MNYRKTKAIIRTFQRRWQYVRDVLRFGKYKPIKLTTSSLPVSFEIKNLFELSQPIFGTIC